MKLHRFIISNIILAAGLMASVAYAGALDIDQAHSSVSFDVNHMVVATVHGSFTKFEGSIEPFEQDLTKSKVNFKVQTNSLSTLNEKRDEHLKGPDFFDVQKFPEATFASTHITKKGKDKYVLEGDLTIHGVNKPVKFDLTYLGKNKDPWGKEKSAFHASTEINRKDFGLTWNKTLESGGLLVGEKVKLIVDIEAEPKAAAK